MPYLKYPSEGHKTQARDATLENLPLDIKVAILKKSANPESLWSLVLSSPAYYEVFSLFRLSIRLAVFCTGLGGDLPLIREACVLYEVQTKLGNEKTTLADMRKLVKENYHAPGTNEAGMLSATPKPTEKPLKQWNVRGYGLRSVDAFVSSYRAVKALGKLFAEKRLELFTATGAQVPPTDTETRNILLAFYRLWILLLLSRYRAKHARTVKRREASQVLQKGDFEKVFGVIPIWEERRVVCVYRFLLDELEPYTRDCLRYRVEGDPMDMFNAPQLYSRGQDASADCYTNNLLQTRHFSTIVRLLSASPDSAAARDIVEPFARYYIPDHSFAAAFGPYLRNTSLLRHRGPEFRGTLRLFRTGGASSYTAWRATPGENYPCDCRREQLECPHVSLWDDWRIEAAGCYYPRDVARVFTVLEDGNGEQWGVMFPPKPL